MVSAAWVLGVALPLRVLTLSEAVTTARTHQPQLRQARAGTEGARARVDQALSPLLPQVTGSFSYQRGTANYAPRAGSTGVAGAATQSSSWDTFNYFNASLTLSQSIYDFGQTLGHWRSARASAESSRANERVSLAQVLLNVRLAFFRAQAAKAMVEVNRQALANQERHLEQVRGFVEVGTRPEIDLAQVRSDVASARLQLLRSQNDYQTAKAQLTQIMGVSGAADFEVGDEALPPIDGEDLAARAQVERALKDRPEVASLARQEQAQRLAIGAVRGGYWPALGLSTSLSETGSELDKLAWNWDAMVTLSWPLLQGGLTRAKVREARASLDSLQAQDVATRQQVELEVVQAQLGLRAAKESVQTAEEALVNARERLRLAEGRYATGVGSGIELGDAQSQLTNAAGQQVVARFNLSSARAQLWTALGRDKGEAR